MNRDLTPPPSSSESYRTRCEPVFSAHHRFWCITGAGSSVYPPNPDRDQALINGSIDCVRAIENLATSTDSLAWRQPIQATEYRWLRRSFHPSTEQRLKEQFDPEGYALLGTFLFALRHLCHFFDSCQRAGIAVITDAEQVPAEAFGYQLHPYCVAFWNHAQAYLNRYGPPIGDLRHWPEHHVNAIALERLPLYAMANVMEVCVQQCESFWNWLNEVKACIEGLRTEARSDPFRGKREDYLKPSQNNHKEMVRYVNKMFEVYGELVILRLDLGYHPDRPMPAMAVVRDHRDEFLKKIKKFSRAKFTPTGPKLNALCGYAVHLYHFPEIGFHYHVLLMLEAAVIDPDQTETMIVSLSQEVGQLWTDTITRGKGVYFPYHVYRQAVQKRLFGFIFRYQSAGIGRYAPHPSSLADIDMAISYLCDTDYFLRLKLPDKQRAFYKGQCPRKRASAAGRPAQHPKKKPSAHGLRHSTRRAKSAPKRHADVVDRLGSPPVGCPNAPPPPGRHGSIALPAVL